MPHHDIGLLSTLVLSLVAAFIGGLGARALHLPPLIGYLFAGVLIGPSTPGIVADQNVASELADIGVSLLLFNIGLHFSFKDLLGVRKIAVPGALTQITLTSFLGALVSLWILDLGLIASLVIGLAFADASTAVVSRVLTEKGQINALPGRIAMGWTVVQDMAVVFALVLLPVLGSIETVPTSDLLTSLGKTLFQITGFVVIMVFGGRKIIPAVLNHVARSSSRELFTLAVAVMALGIAYGSAMIFGVSLALGAFFAGVVIGESDLNHHATSESLPIQQIFTILFFVSIGMLFDPLILSKMPLEIFAFLLVVLLGTGFLTFLLLVALRVPLHAAALVGGAFAQIGEFSFVLSALGYKNGLYGAAERDMIVAVAILSIVINPLVLSFAVRMAKRLHETAWFTARRASHPPPEGFLSQDTSWEEHVVLVGCGRVGTIVAQALQKHGVSFIAIDTDRRLVEKLRKRGDDVIYGDASRETVLAAAHPEQAKLLIITIPDSYYARQIIRQAKKINPNIEIVVRTHSDEEVRLMSRLGLEMIVMGEREIAFGIAYHVLQKLGLEVEKTREAIDFLRKDVYEAGQKDPLLKDALSD